MNPKILIVDDIVVNRMTIKLSLKSEDYQFVEAKDGLQAIEIARVENPDIILMDALMPVMDGFEATKRIREIDQIQRIPILMITSLDSKEDKIHAIECGVNDFINKSFDKTELKARCKAYIELSKLNKKYILASKNIVSGFPNKIELLKNTQEENGKKSLFLIDMDNYGENESFYGLEIAENLERVFLDFLTEYCFNVSDDYQIYHISTGQYAVVFDKQFSTKDKSIEEFCTNLIGSIRDHSFKYQDYGFDINVTMAYMSDSNTLYNDANIMLTLARKDDLKFMIDIKKIDTFRDNIKNNLHILHDIKQAIKNDKIEPFYQPIYNNNLNCINRYEALIRMYDRNDKILFPYPNFLDIAKQSQLYPYVTKILIEKVMHKIRTNNCEISINLSTLDIENTVMQSFILDVFKKNRDITDRLIVELLEDKETNSYEEIKGFIKKIKSYGVKIAIDDFGSGFSNFIRIIEFDPDIIKIDGSLIENITTSKESQQAVETIKIFADKIGAKVVAEYVENEEIFNLMQKMDIDYAQGYYIGKAELELRRKAEFIKERVI